MKKSILITGAAGFIGSHLCDKFIGDGFNVIGIDNFYTGSLNNICHLKNNSCFKFIETDITKPFEINEHIDYILNFACPASPVAYQKDPIFTLNTCFNGVLNALEIAKKNKAIFLQASTSEVYGDPLEHPQKESYWGNVNPCGVRSCYDEGKRVGESLVFDFGRQNNFEVKVIRIFNTYGPRMDRQDGRVVSNFIVQALNNEPITVYGKGDQTRSICYVSDLVSGIDKMLFSAAGFRGPVNLGSDFEITIEDLAKKVIELTGSKSKIVYEKLPSDDPKKRRADLTLARKKLGYEPKISIDEGLKKTIDFFKQS
ncbi:MAG: SDR family oxidoreductase [Elusimicrobiota bacterium]|jgi:UDP-glucuronate decarboxylase|nr:SDR family oxidoreductase [Elusimicrobiota bacterium]